MITNWKERKDGWVVFLLVLSVALYWGHNDIAPLAGEDPSIIAAMFIESLVILTAVLCARFIGGYFMEYTRFFLIADIAGYNIGAGYHFMRHFDLGQALAMSLSLLLVHVTVAILLWVLLLARKPKEQS